MKLRRKLDAKNLSLQLAIHSFHFTFQNLVPILLLSSFVICNIAIFLSPFLVWSSTFQINSIFACPYLIGLFLQFIWLNSFFKKGFIHLLIYFLVDFIYSPFYVLIFYYFLISENEYQESQATK